MCTRFNCVGRCRWFVTSPEFFSPLATYKRPASERAPTPNAFIGTTRSHLAPSDDDSLKWSPRDRIFFSAPAAKKEEARRRGRRGGGRRVANEAPRSRRGDLINDGRTDGRSRYGGARSRSALMTRGRGIGEVISQHVEFGKLNPKDVVSVDASLGSFCDLTQRTRPRYRFTTFTVICFFSFYCDR